MEVIIGIIRGIIGIAVIIGLGYQFSLARKSINWRLVFSGLVLQLLIAFLVLKVGFISSGIESISGFFIRLLEFSERGSVFIFGETLVTDGSFGARFAFRVLPSIIFFSAFTSALYFLGILQKIVFLCAWVMSKTMHLSGAESLSAAANIFIGQTEAPLVVKPYLERMTRSEILCLMTGGMATIAGAVLVAYIQFLGGDDPQNQREVGKMLLTASFMAAPGAIICSKLLLPETKKVDRVMKVSRESIGENIFDAVVRGATQGLQFAFNVGAMLLVFIAMIALLDFIAKEWIGSWTGLNVGIVNWTGGLYDGLSLKFIFGLLFAPVAFLIGVDPGNLLLVGQLLGEKMVLNEFYAYSHMGTLLADGTLTDPKSIIICTFALCGFANFSSMGIQIGGISVLAPKQRETLAKLAFRALIGGTMASLLSATMAGMIA